jgi:hypothetical protein
VTNLKVCSQKIVPIFLFLPGYFNYDYRKASLWAENCPNFLAGRKKLKFFSGKFALVADKPQRGPGKLPHSVPKGPKSGRTSFKTREGLVQGKVFSGK